MLLTDAERLKKGVDGREENEKISVNCEKSWWKRKYFNKVRIYIYIHIYIALVSWDYHKWLWDFQRYKRVRSQPLVWPKHFWQKKTTLQPCMLPLEHTNSQGWYYFLPSAKPSHSDGWNIPDSQKENTSIFDSMRGPSSSQLCVALRVAYVTKKNVWFSACWHCEKWKILGFQRFHLNQLTRGTNLVDTTLSMSTLADPKKTSPQKTYHAETETCATLSIISYHTPLPPKKNQDMQGRQKTIHNTYDPAVHPSSPSMKAPSFSFLAAWVSRWLCCDPNPRYIAAASSWSLPFTSRLKIHFCEPDGWRLKTWKLLWIFCFKPKIYRKKRGNIYI